MKLLESIDDITPEIEESVVDCLDWFQDVSGLNTEDFIDRLCDTYGGNDWDIGQYNNSAVRKIMRVAREAKREQTA